MTHTAPSTIVLLLHPDGGSWRFDGPTAMADARNMAAVERSGSTQTIAVYELKSTEQTAPQLTGVGL